jgi:hypothetical protein
MKLLLLNRFALGTGGYLGLRGDDPKAVPSPNIRDATLTEVVPI